MFFADKRIVLHRFNAKTLQGFKSLRKIRLRNKTGVKVYCALDQMGTMFLFLKAWKQKLGLMVKNFNKGRDSNTSVANLDLIKPFGENL